MRQRVCVSETERETQTEGETQRERQNEENVCRRFSHGAVVEDGDDNECDDGKCEGAAVVNHTAGLRRG